MLGGLQSILDGISPELRDALARIVAAGLILLATWVIRQALTRIILRPIRGRVERTPGQVDDRLLEIIQQPIKFVVSIIGLALAVEALGLDPLASQFVNRVVRSGIIIAIALGLYRIVTIISFSSAQLRSLTGLSIEERLVPFVRVILRLVIVLVAITIVLQEWGFDVTGLIAGLGLGGLAISLAAKDTVENLFGFAAIVTDRPFVVGDLISVGIDEGVVEHVGLRSTRLRRNDQARVIMPNSRVAASTLTNFSRMQKRWLDMTIGISPTQTSGQMTALLDDIRASLLENKNVDPASVLVALSGFGAGKLDLMIRSDIRLANYAEFAREREAISLRILDLIQGAGLEVK
jgi:MscS family membrane protein